MQCILFKARISFATEDGKPASVSKILYYIYILYLESIKRKGFKRGRSTITLIITVSDLARIWYGNYVSIVQ